MSLRRYIGRATGTRRIQKSWKIPKPSFLTWMLFAAGVMLALGAIVWVVNPGSNVPDEEKGTQQSSGVTPTGTPTTSTTPSGHKRHHPRH